MKIFISFIISLILSISTVPLMACDNGPDKNTPPAPKNCEVVLETTIYASGNYENFIALCRSYEELKESCINNGYDFFNVENQTYNLYNSEAGEIIRQLNDTDFEEETFIVCGFCNSDDSGQFRIEDVETQGENLTLYINSPCSEIGLTVINCSFLLAKVNTVSILNITNINYSVR